MDRTIAGVRILAMALVGCNAKTNVPSEKFLATDVTGSPWGRDFHLPDQNGRSRRLADFRGTAVTLYFGYTHCPVVCQATLTKLVQARKKLGNAQDRLLVLFVTVDPKRATPAVLKQYVAAFDPTFLGLRGDDAAAAQTAKDFKVFFKHEHAISGNDMVAHSSGVYAFDPQGRLRLYMDAGLSPEAMAHDIELLLKS